MVPFPVTVRVVATPLFLPPIQIVSISRLCPFKSIVTVP